MKLLRLESEPVQRWKDAKPTVKTPTVVYVNPKYIISITKKESGSEITVQDALVARYSDKRSQEEITKILETFK